MADLNVNGVMIPLDEDGFLEDSDLWNEEVAKALALTEDVEELTEEHWLLINYLRDYYQKLDRKSTRLNSSH